MIYSDVRAANVFQICDSEKAEIQSICQWMEYHKSRVYVQLSALLSRENLTTGSNDFPAKSSVVLNSMSRVTVDGLVGVSR